MIRVTTGSRLHFGLIAPGGSFGGAGLMLAAPATTITFARSKVWEIRGPSTVRDRLDRHLAALQRHVHDLPPLQVNVATAPPEHVGLGAGTQLALAFGAGVLAASGHGLVPAVELALMLERRPRSGIGIHGFELGGFIVDEGRAGETKIATLARRLAFPEAWRVVLLRPQGQPGFSGMQETRAFAELREPAERVKEREQVLWQRVIPALEREDFETFAASLYDYNHRAGEAFHEVQGGTYASPAIHELVSYFQQRGVTGVGQSSWGPTVFALAATEDEANHVASLGREFGMRDDDDGSLIVTKANNRGCSLDYAFEMEGMPR